MTGKRSSRIRQYCEQRILYFRHTTHSFSYLHTPLEEYTRSRRDNEIEALERGDNTASFVTSPTPNVRASAIQVTEIIDKDDPRASSTEMNNAIKEEVRDLLRRGTFKVVLKEELPDGANALTARFVLAIKSNADGKIKYKARYVIGGHRDKLKHYMVHGAQTLQASSARLLLSLAAAFDFEVWTSDVKLAYLQSTKPLERRVFIKNPAPEFEIHPSECFELLRPLYGLCDAGDLWHQSLNQHLTEELHLQPTKADPSLYFSFRGNKLVGINGSYVDDLLRSGDSEFKNWCKRTHEKFETSGDEPLPVTFAGFQISRNEHNLLSMDQTFYIRRLEELDPSLPFTD